MTLFWNHLPYLRRQNSKHIPGFWAICSFWKCQYGLWCNFLGIHCLLPVFIYWQFELPGSHHTTLLLVGNWLSNSSELSLSALWNLRMERTITMHQIWSELTTVIGTKSALMATYTHLALLNKNCKYGLRQWTTKEINLVLTEFLLTQTEHVHKYKQKIQLHMFTRFCTNAHVLHLKASIMVKKINAMLCSVLAPAQKRIIQCQTS